MNDPVTVTLDPYAFALAKTLIEEHAREAEAKLAKARAAWSANPRSARKHAHYGDMVGAAARARAAVAAFGKV